jgi:hypothetical protein
MNYQRESNYILNGSQPLVFLVDVLEMHLVLVVHVIQLGDLIKDGHYKHEILLQAGLGPLERGLQHLDEKLPNES